MAEEKGWIKLYRCLLEKAVWKNSTPDQRSVLITVLLLANHERNQWEWQGQKFFCEPGQFITSLSSLAKTAKVSVQSVRSALLKLEKLEFLTNKSTKTGRLITIVNWDTYQANDEELNNESNKEPTKSQQRANKEPTTNKNVRMKECKNDKKDKKINESNMNVFIPPKIEEVISYCQERQKGIDPHKWYDFYSAKGWMIGKNKMKDWKAAVRTWEKDSPPKPKKTKYDNVYL